MGRLRQYMIAGDMRHPRGSLGDPFRFRLPKKLRKLQPGKLLKKALPLAASIIPGGSAIARLAGGVTSARDVDQAPAVMMPQLDDMTDQSEEPAWMQFARAFGLDVGDPGPATASKRKRAGAGPKAKAAAKKSKRMGIGATLGASLKGSAKAAGSVLPSLAGQLSSGNVQGAMMQLLHAPQGGIAALGHARSGHRRINATNVRALRRGIRRIEAFERIVKSVHKAYPRIARAAHHSAARSSGHRAGCGCFRCRKRS